MENQNYLRRFFVAALTPAFFSFATIIVSVSYYRQYGMVLFVLLPFLIGLASTVLYGRDKLLRVFSVTFSRCFF